MLGLRTDKGLTMTSDGLLFATIPAIYNEARPGYPKELYDEIAGMKKITSQSIILEIGSGQGIATKEIIDKWHCSVVAIEPGIELLDIAQKRLYEEQNVKYENCTFEEYQSKNAEYDAIFSATSFHWLDKAIKYKKAYSLLKDDGILVLYWNNFGIADKEADEKIRRIYAKHGFGSKQKNWRKLQNEKIEDRKNEINESGVFELIGHRIFERNINYSAELYIKLLNTFPDHSKMNIENIQEFYDEIKRFVIKNNDCIHVSVNVNLEIARKKRNLTIASTG